MRTDIATKAEGMMSALKLVAVGCKKHPAYRGLRKPAASCETCGQIWEARKALAELRIIE